MIHLNKCADLNGFNTQINFLFQCQDEEITANIKQIAHFFEINQEYLQFSKKLENLSEKLSELQARISKIEGSEQESIEKIHALFNRIFAQPSAPSEFPLPSEAPDLLKIVDFSSELVAIPLDEPAVARAVLPDPLLTDEQWKERFNTLNPKFLERQTTYIKAHGILNKSPYYIAGGATALFFCFTATPIVVLGVTTAAVATFAGSYFAADYFNPERHEFLNDPEYLRETGQEIERDIVKNNRSFNYIKSNYSELMNHGLLTEQDLNRLFHNQIYENIFYQELRQLLGKNDSSNTFEWGFTFDASNREILKEKALSPLFTEKESMSLSERQALGISTEELHQSIAMQCYDQLVNQKIDFSDFEGKMSNKWNYLSESQMKMIHTLAISHYSKSNRGLGAILALPSSKAIRISYEELIKNEALTPDIKELALGHISYENFRKKHTLQAIKTHQLIDRPQSEKEAVKWSLIRSYREMNTYAFDDFDILGYKYTPIIKEVIENAISQEKSIFKNYHDQKVFIENNFNQKKSFFAKDLSELKNQNLLPVQRNLKNKTNELDKLKQTENTEKATIEDWEKRKKEYNLNCNKLLSAKTEHDDLCRRTKLYGQFDPREKTDLEHDENELIKKQKRKKEVAEKLKDLQNLPQMEAKIGCLKNDIDHKSDRIQKIHHTPVRGAIPAVSALLKEGGLALSRGSQTRELHHLEEKVSKIKQENEASLKNEMLGYHSVESELQSVKNQLNGMRERERTLKRLQTLSSEIIDLNSRIENFNLQKQFYQDLETTSRLNLNTTKANILILQKEIADIKNSEKQIESELENSYKNKIKLESEQQKKALADCENKKIFEMEKIERTYLDQIKQAIG